MKYRDTAALALSISGLTFLLGLSAFARPGGGGPTSGRDASAAGALLSAKCLKCHDAEKRSGGVDLSSRAAALAAKAFGADGRLARAVSSGRMPPAGRLPADEIALIRRWLAGGATYPSARLAAETPLSPTLWSFHPVRRPAVPATKFSTLAANPIDRFIFAKLEQNGLAPSPLAGRRELLRRVTIDLTGLPPTPEEIAAFLADRSPNGYEKVVDRLLASPAYGERWGRHWLDVVRYGESTGYEQNHLRPNAWPYRDYVIRAFNADKPYDQFVAEQIAGDALAKGDPDAEAATGFLVAGVHDNVGIQTEEGTRQQRANDLEDIVSTTGAAFLGLTVGCAKCHDHKFDPIPQKDFYRLAAVFAGVRHGERPLPSRKLTEQEQREAAEAAQRILACTTEINAIDGLARETIQRERGAAKDSRPAVNARQNVDDFSPVEARYVRFTILATKDGTEPCLDEIQLFSPGKPENIALASAGAKATASSVLPGFAIHQIAHLNDGKTGNDWSWISAARGSGWVQIDLPAPTMVSRVVWSRDSAVIPRFDDRIPSVYRIEVSVDARSWKTVSTEAGRAGNSDYIHPDALQKAMTTLQRERRKQLVEEAAKLKERAEQLGGKTTAYVGQFTQPDEMFVLRRGDVMQRAEKVSPGGLSLISTMPADLADEKAPEPERRIALARWITDRRNPLTARVMANRMWQYHFGRGLVGTPSDFGRNGEKPSHTELLDWLAAELMNPTSDAHAKTQRRKEGQGQVTTEAQRHRGKARSCVGVQVCGCVDVNGKGAENVTGRTVGANKPPRNKTWTSETIAAVYSPNPTKLDGTPNAEHQTPNASPSLNPKSQILNPRPWSLKRIHKLMLMSYAYRQTSAGNPAGQAKDAGNVLLWHMPLRRMEAEAVRDAMLLTSGKLNRRMGGPGYRLFKYTVVNVGIYEPLDDYPPETWRRSIYQQSARAVRDDLLATFDCPECAQRAPRRENTTTALQALSLLNGLFTIQQAGFFADRVKAEAGPRPDAQVTHAFELAFGRPPRPQEKGAALALAAKRSLPDLCRALMNANEFLYY